jgi:hypothetical protein
MSSLTQTTVTSPGQLSVALPPLKSCGGTSPGQLTLIGGGQLIVGGVMSPTVIVWLHVLEQPLLSTTLNDKVKLVLQLALVPTLITRLLVEPRIIPPPLMVQV